ncbi:uncharacterized protein TNCV_3355611 [Trichonephila clavipes]|nr:uncharacterized protein TNCV_3355611 [Trichonephila clavipes]
MFPRNNRVRLYPSIFSESNGKLRPFKLLEKSVEYQLACQEIITEDERTFATLKKFIRHMYGVPNSSNIIMMLASIYFPKLINRKDLMIISKRKCRNFDLSSLPPCKSELYQHLLRVRYVTKFWRNAHLKIPSSLSPLASRWIINDDNYDFVWFAGEQFPSSVADIVIKNSSRTTSGEIYYFLEDSRGFSELANMVANLVTKNDANLALPPRFRQILIESPL